MGFSVLYSRPPLFFPIPLQVQKEFLGFQCFFDLRSHSLYGTDGLKIHGNQEGGKEPVLFPAIGAPVPWFRTKIPFFFMEKIPSPEQNLVWISRAIPSNSFCMLLHVFFPLVLSGLTLYPLPPPIYPRKWGCSGIQWEEGRSCWLLIRGLLAGSGGASLLFNGIEE